MATHQSVLTPTQTFSPSSEVATTWQTDSAAYKLKPRLFHKFTQLQVHSADFHPSVNHAWHDISVSICLLFVEASLLICKDPSHSDNASILFVLLELILVSHSFHYMCFISQQITLSSIVCIQWARWCFTKCNDLKLELRLQLRQRLEEE